MFKYNYIEGQKIGELIFINRAGSAGERNHARPLANFKCPYCGNEFICRIESAKNLSTKSCGCVSTKLMTKHLIKHGHNIDGISSEYKSWQAMWQRCTNPKHSNYPTYKNIEICEEWRTFERFISDMGLKPTIKHSIDREDNNKGYNKDNCRWATKKEQSRNTSVTTFVEYLGIKKSIAEWADLIGFPLSTLYGRLIPGKWDIERAFTTPLRGVLPQKIDINNLNNNV